MTIDDVIADIENSTRVLTTAIVSPPTNERERVTIERALKLANLAYQLNACARVFHEARPLAARS